MLKNSLQNQESPLVSGPGKPRAPKVKGGGFELFPGFRLDIYILICPPWGEEKAGFGAQPRDFHGTLALWAQVHWEAKKGWNQVGIRFCNLSRDTLANYELMLA